MSEAGCEVVNSQPVSGPISSAWASIKAADIIHGQQALEDPDWDFCPAKGFLLPKCFTAPTFFSNLVGPMWWWCYLVENNSTEVGFLKLNWLTVGFRVMSCNVIFKRQPRLYVFWCGQHTITHVLYQLLAFYAWFVKLCIVIAQNNEWITAPHHNKWCF